jgi:hypothetical protein
MSMSVKNNSRKYQRLSEPKILCDLPSMRTEDNTSRTNKYQRRPGVLLTIDQIPRVELGSVRGWGVIYCYFRLC